jgi:PAS domain S-box-containing protein
MVPKAGSPQIQASEAALRLSEATRSAILEAALDGIVTIDHNGRVLDFNPAAEKTFGYSRTEALGREMAELIIPPHLRDQHRKGLALAVASGRDHIVGRRIEITAMRRNGEQFPVELAITRIATAGPPMFTGHIRDITAHKQRQQRQDAQYAVARILAGAGTLEEASSQLVQAVCESLQWDMGAIWHVDAARDELSCAGVWHGASHRQERFEAATRQGSFKRGVGLPGRIWAGGEPRWIPDVTKDPNFPRFSLAVEEGLHSAFGFPIRLGAQVLGVIEFFSHEIRQPDPDVLEMFAAIGSQIGQFMERQRAESELRRLNTDLERRVAEGTSRLGLSEARAKESDRRFSRMFHANPAMVCLIRLTDGRVIDANPALIKVSGYRPEEIIGRSIAELALWASTEQQEEFIRALRQQGSLREQELTFRAKDGRLDHVLLSAEVVEINGEPHALTAALDIGARKLAEEELQRALSREKELNRLKSNFVTLVSHEFRTPLGVIMSAAEILENYFERLAPGRRREHLQDIGQATRQMADLMEQVLLLGKIESDRMPNRVAPLELADYCGKLVEEVIAATARKCPIVFEAGKISGTARGDESLIRHIFTNILGNAVKYSAAGSEVRFCAERDGTDAVFVVRDRGIGIPEEDAAQLFTSFHRGSNVGEVPGSGLGLGIVKRCVDLHGGTIAVRSQLDEGTEVTVRLPLFGSASARRRLAAVPDTKAKPRRAMAGSSSRRRRKNRKVS